MIFSAYKHLENIAVSLKEFLFGVDFMSTEIRVVSSSDSHHVLSQPSDSRVGSAHLGDAPGKWGPTMSYK